MSILWPEWLRPLWLLAVPVLAWLLWRLWHRERQSGRWHCQEGGCGQQHCLNMLHL